MEVSIMKRSINVGPIIDFINRLESEKRLDPETRGQIAKAITSLEHGLAITNFKKDFKAIDELSRALTQV
jgi:hypothetical protein